MTATIALPRQPHTDFLSRLRSIGLGLGARGSLGWGLGRSRAGAAAATPWYLAGGAPMPVAAYQPIRAASLAASYVNLANPGTYNAAPGVAPTFDAATGWTFNGLTQHLNTGVLPKNGWGMLVRVSDVLGTGCAIGTVTSFVLKRFHLFPANGSARAYGYEANLNTGSSITSGVMALAGGATSADCYLDGSLSATVSGTFVNTTYPLYIGARNNNNSIDTPFPGKVQAVAIYSTTLDAAQVAQISAAMAAL